MSAANNHYSHTFTQNPVPPSHDDHHVSSAHAHQAVTADEELLDDPTYPTTTTTTTTQDILPPPDFRPFFTLIQDPDTGEHHHPSVHYIFSDDNSDFVTSAIVDAIDQEQAESSADQPARERLILLHVGPDGKTVNDAQSLSSQWQILKTTVGQAPSWADDVSRKDTSGLMLNIQGMESRKLKLQPNRRRNSQEDIMARVEAMIGGYTDCLKTLDSIIKRDVVEDEEDTTQALEGQQAGLEHEE